MTTETGSLPAETQITAGHGHPRLRTDKAEVSGATVNDDGGVTFVEDEIGQDANDPTPAAGRGIAL